MATTSNPSRGAGPAAPIRVAATDTVDTDGGIVRFDGTIIKVNADGVDVMSDHLMPGERLRREDTDRYSAIRVSPPDEDKKAAAKRDDTK